MPLLKRKPLKKVPMPDFLRDEDTVFHCEMTNEIFRDYDEFAERTILCNSMVWTCSLTGKSNLTYVEALQSEKNALKSLKEFPDALRKVVLFLATKTKRSGFGEMAEDVYMYMKDRYFVGETMEPPFSGSKWRDCKVTQVIAPSDNDIEKTKNGSTEEKTFFPPASLYKYNLETVDSDDRDISETVIVDFSKMRRKKGMYSREKNKLLLKQHVEQNDDGVWIIKPSSMKEFGIDDLKFDDIFDGPLPIFETSKKIERRSSGMNGKKVRQETLAKFLSKNNIVDNGHKKSEGSTLLEKMNKKTAMFKKMKEDEKKRLAEEKIAEKQKKHEENLQVSKMLKDWYKPKEDLELEDHKKLPDVVPIKSKVDEMYVGDILTVVEFVDYYAKVLKTKDFFPEGLTFELMERALVERELAGPLIDLIQMFLITIFEMQNEEANQYKKEKISAREMNEKDLDDYDKLEKVITSATKNMKWPARYQGMQLENLPMYPLTVSEILRLHFLMSGGKIGTSGINYRYQTRGGYLNENDPGLQLRMKHPHLIKALSHHNIVQFPVNEKIRIINCLVDQLLSFADFRDIAEERVENQRQAKLDLKSTEAAEKRRLQEFKSARSKLKRENKDNNDYVNKMLNSMNYDSEKKQSEYENQVKECIKICNDHLILLGCDRSHRRYYKLDSIPGLIVQDEELNAGHCLEDPTPQNPALIDAGEKETLSHLRTVFEEMNSSDKENSKNNKKANGMQSKLITDAKSLSDLRLCTGELKNCIVHSKTLKKSRWSFYDTPEKVKELLSSLNKRGLRESDLMQSVESNLESLSKSISKTPLGTLNSSLENPEEVEKNKRKSKGKYEGNLGYSLEMHPVEILHTMLTDYILELEEKIHAGSLGSLKIKDRYAWRKNLQDRNYDELDTTLVKLENGALPSSDKVKNEDKNGSRASTPDSLSDEKKVDYKDPGFFLGPVNEEDYEDAEEWLTCSSEVQKAVECLAIALAQIATGIEQRFLKKPLGKIDIGKRVIMQDKLEFWMQSLLASTSFSQISLHYGTLDSCILWSRSVLLAKCRICRYQRDSENMLLCDSCNLGHHLYCLKPKLKVVPAGKWYCYKCKEEAQSAEPTPPPPTRKRRIFRDEDVEDDDEDEDSDVKEEPAEEPVTKKRKLLRIDFNGPEKNGNTVRNEEADDSSEEEEDSDEVKVDLCGMCGSSGELIYCDRCPKCFHIECVEPPLRRPPRGKWTCHKCTQKANRRDSSSSRDVFRVASSLTQRHGANSQRQCAARARHKIHGYAKFLQNSEDFNDSDGDELITNHRRSNRRDVDGRDDLPLHNAALQELLADVMKHKDAWPFIRPVQKTEVPDYYEVISKPMDFGTIKYKLNMGKYMCDSELMSDCVLVFENCNTYNDTDAIVYKCGVKLLKHFRKKSKELSLKVPEEMQSDSEEEPTKKRSRTK